MTQREIKFRKWAKHINGEMAIVDDVILGGATLNSLRKNDGDVLMQYTGLLDRNGKEIYEGDILRFEAWKKTGVIIYNLRELGFIFRENESRYVSDLGAFSEDAFEIIGNVYENPDLIKN